MFKVPTPKYWQTSLARSAKLGDTSWARLTTEQTSWNLPDSQLRLKSKTEPSVTKLLNYIWGGHRTTLKETEQSFTGRGGHRTYFVAGDIHETNFR